jgi:hypothetical protein
MGSDGVRWEPSDQAIQPFPQVSGVVLAGFKSPSLRKEPRRIKSSNCQVGLRAG